MALRGSIIGQTRLIGKQLLRDLETVPPDEVELAYDEYQCAGRKQLTIVQWIRAVNTPKGQGVLTSRLVRLGPCPPSDRPTERSYPVLTDAGEFDEWNTVTEPFAMQLIYAVGMVEAKDPQGCLRPLLENIGTKMLGESARTTRDTIEHLIQTEYMVKRSAVRVSEKNNVYLRRGPRSYYEERYLHLLSRVYPVERAKVDPKKLLLVAKAKG